MNPHHQMPTLDDGARAPSTVVPGPGHRREPELGAAAAGAPPGELAQTLVRQCGLTERDVERIRSTADQLGLGFVEAAVRLRVVSQDDLDAALGQSRGPRAGAGEARASSELVSARDPFDAFSESIRALRTELLLRAQGEDSNVIAVVSPCPGEGRSRLAAELAVAFSQLGQGTLLIDADFRGSRQHELFGAGNEQGLAQALMDGKMPAVKTVSGLPMLSVLTAGSRPTNPLELLSDQVFGDLLGGWRRRFKHILIDTPPVAGYADALAVATHAGRVLMITRAHRTALKESKSMLQRLEVTRARILGSVLNEF